MPGHNLTVASRIQCPHGGQAILSAANTHVFADSALALLETDIHTVAGCPFTIGTKYSPCVRIEWSAGASNVSVSGTPVLVRSSLGKCYSPENAVQGFVSVVNTQTKGFSR
ncbi:MAG TPA: hypothetical protein VII57_00750 [Dehalococcoidia bacterium]